MNEQQQLDLDNFDERFEAFCIDLEVDANMALNDVLAGVIRYCVTHQIYTGKKPAECLPMLLNKILDALGSVDPGPVIRRQELAHTHGQDVLDKYDSLDKG